MYDLYPYFTNDGSIGLYSPQADDIYHSVYGALTEAYQKFILPADFENYFLNNNQIKILDICYGIGYNSKSFLNYFFENIFKNKKFLNAKKLYNETIYTDNNLTNKKSGLSSDSTTCNVSLHTDKIFDNKNINSSENYKIYIKTIDTDKNLVYLSPFFKNFGKNKKMLFSNEKIEKFQKVKVERKYKLKKYINHIIFENLIKNFGSDLFSKELEDILFDKKYTSFFDPNICRLYKSYKFTRYPKTSKGLQPAFLHNIYYRYITKRHKKALNGLKIDNINIDYKINDARNVILEDKNTYNFVFLDGFTPAKCPMLWTEEFLKLLYEHLDDGGMVLTYSCSANVRNALSKAGFNIGKNYSAELNKDIGTIAVKNSDVKYPLSELDLGLMKTRAGIIYHDKNFTLTNEQILAAHKKDVENSTLMSSTSYLKTLRHSNVRNS